MISIFYAKVHIYFELINFRRKIYFTHLGIHYFLFMFADIIETQKNPSPLLGKGYLIFT